MIGPMRMPTSEMDETSWKAGFLAALEHVHALIEDSEMVGLDGQPHATAPAEDLPRHIFDLQVASDAAEAIWKLVTEADSQYALNAYYGRLDSEGT